MLPVCGVWVKFHFKTSRATAIGPTRRLPKSSGRTRESTQVGICVEAIEKGDFPKWKEQVQS